MRTNRPVSELCNKYKRMSKGDISDKEWLSAIMPGLFNSGPYYVHNSIFLLVSEKCFQINNKNNICKCDSSAGFFYLNSWVNIEFTGILFCINLLIKYFSDFKIKLLQSKQW